MKDITNLSNDYTAKKKHTWLPDNGKTLLVVSVLLALGTYAGIIRYKDKINKIKSIFRDPWFIFNGLIILAFICYAFIGYKSDSYMVLATKRGIYAMFIAFCALLEIPYTPFWVTHLLAYFAPSWL